ncbi:hypothetical protein CASFOL_020402 [Castilleja foliolosa]|uniref:Uncharacterized protein n=1 Tax=Castilleja foliolosa TaxID=1961234 RepID=A0ABD3D0R4_9LAMI
MSNLGKKTTDDDEVELLLRAAQDDMLLKLSLNSHAARASATIDPDLDRRFEALKNPQKPAKIGDRTKKLPAKTDAGVSSKSSGDAADDDLLARFAALKSSLPSQNRSEQKSSLLDGVEEDESEDEVQKVINWAIDAARLDPSPPSDDDDDDTNDEDDDDSDDGDDSDIDNRKKGKTKTK